MEGVGVGMFSLFPILLVNQRDSDWPSLNRSRLDPSAGCVSWEPGFCLALVLL